MLERSGRGVSVLGLDVDPEALARSTSRLARFGDRVRLVRASFRDVERVARTAGLTTAHAVLLDLGVSSYQIDESGRGFSFQRDEPLDMRLDPSAPRTAADLLNTLPEASRTQA